MVKHGMMRYSQKSNAGSVVNQHVFSGEFKLSLIGDFAVYDRIEIEVYDNGHSSVSIFQGDEVKFTFCERYYASILKDIWLAGGIEFVEKFCTENGMNHLIEHFKYHDNWINTRKLKGV